MGVRGPKVWWSKVIRWAMKVKVRRGPETSVCREKSRIANSTNNTNLAVVHEHQYVSECVQEAGGAREYDVGGHEGPCEGQGAQGVLYCHHAWC